MPIESSANESSYKRSPVGTAASTPRSIRLLHVVAGNLYGGVESYLATTARLGRLNPVLKHEFAVCYPGRLLEELTAQHAMVHALGPAKMGRPWTVWRARSKLADIVRAQNTDAVITHGSWAHLLFSSAAKNAGARLVYYTHDNLDQVSWIDRFAGRSPPDLVLANSRFTLRGARRLFPSSPAEVCYLPVELPEIPPTERTAVRRELGASDDGVVLIQASRFERWKGHIPLLNALGTLSKLPDWELWIVGGAQRPHEVAYRRELEDLAKQQGITNRVRFLGQRSDVPRLLAAADIFCQANLRPEPFGLVFIEAMYAKLPIVTSDFGGASEILSGACGVLVPPGNTTALSETLRNLIENADERRRYASGAPLRAADLCDPGKHVNALHRAISRIAENRH